MTTLDHDAFGDDAVEAAEDEPVPAGAVHAPSREDPLVARLSAVVGGPAGWRLADPRGLWRAATVLVVLATGVLALAVAAKAHCIRRGWSTPDQFWHVCYSDLPARFSSGGLGGTDTASLPEALGKLGQPPLAGTFMWLVAQLVPAGTVSQQTLWFFDASVGVLAAALLAAVIAVAAAARRRGWDAALLALSPVLVTTAFVSYDLLAVALLAWALLLWSRARPLLCGVLLGTAVATRPVYAVLGVALVALALRTGRYREVLLATGTAAVVWFGLRVLLLQGWTGQVGSAWDTWRAQGAGYGSVWFVPDLLSRVHPRQGTWWPSSGLAPPLVTALALTLLVALVAAALLLALGTSERPRLAHLALFLLAGALLIGKEIPPQAGLLLLPLVALSALRWRDALLWAGAEVTYYVAVWLYIAADSDTNRGMPPAPYAIITMVRAAGLVWLMVCAVRAARNPLIDPVRSPVEGIGDDDPLAGGLDEAPDALVVRIR